MAICGSCNSKSQKFKDMKESIKEQIWFKDQIKDPVVVRSGRDEAPNVWHPHKRIAHKCSWLTARSPEMLAPARIPVAAGKKMANTEKNVSPSLKSGPMFSHIILPKTGKSKQKVA